MSSDIQHEILFEKYIKKYQKFLKNIKFSKYQISKYQISKKEKNI